MQADRRSSMAGPPRRGMDRIPRRPIVAIGALAATLAVGFSLLGGADRGPGAGPTGGAGSSTTASNPPIPGHEVYGFVPYWEMDGSIADHLDGTDATTIALFSVTHTGKGGLATNLTGYRRIVGPIGQRIIADVHQRGRRVDIAYTSFGEARNATLFASEALQERVITALVAFRSEVDADGLAVDVEGIANSDIPAYGVFIGRLRAALRADGPSTRLTVTAGAGQQGSVLAAAANLAGADRIFLMGYDYRTVTSQPGASAPLARRDGGERTLGWSLDLYAALGIPADRTILGLPLYGMSWPVASADLGAAATGRGAIWVPRQNLATLDDPSLVPSYDSVEDVAFLAIPDGAAWRAVYYDTPTSLTAKLALADDRGLAGAGFWALGYERGLPDYTDLIATFRAGRLAVLASPSIGMSPGTSDQPAAASGSPAAASGSPSAGAP